MFEYLRAREHECGFTVRMTILGHIQRGGRPTAAERVLATRLAVAAVENLTAGHTGVMVGLVDNKIQLTDLAQVVSCHKGVDLRFYDLATTLEFGRAKLAKPAAVAVPELPRLEDNGRTKVTLRAPEEL